MVAGWVATREWGLDHMMRGWGLVQWNMCWWVASMCHRGFDHWVPDIRLQMDRKSDRRQSLHECVCVCMCGCVSGEGEKSWKECVYVVVALNPSPFTHKEETSIGMRGYEGLRRL